MPEPRYRSRSLRRKSLTVPGGRHTIHYERKKPSGARCAICGGILHGVPRSRPSEIRKLQKTKKRPERTHGGHICSTCLMRLLKQEARNISWPAVS
ncbi:MAG: 50S ribosomal protein L34e [Candidatus Bathyarchaeia archaeon]